MIRRALYTNSAPDKIAFNFFVQHGGNCESAQLACPFFTTAEPLMALRQARHYPIQLIVRLCLATEPKALAEALQLRDVLIRHHPKDGGFHAKFYILGNIALIGSANLTRAGLRENREIAVTLHGDDPLYDDLRAYFHTLWSESHTHTLSMEVLEHFTNWHTKASRSTPPEYAAVLSASHAFVGNAEERQSNAMQPGTYSGMGLREACIKYLRITQQPHSAKEIFASLKEAGFVFRFRKPGPQPYRPVYAALMMGERVTGDILNLGGGKWSLTEWHTAEEIVRLNASHSASLAPDRVERTKQGMRAARKKGKRIGQPPRFDAIAAKRALEMFRDGKGVREVARALAVSPATIYNHITGGGGLRGLREKGKI